jgi:phosphohistidine phosphatase SixA
MAAFLVWLAATGSSQAQTPAPGQVILDQLRTGGLTIYLRHAPATMGEDQINDADFWRHCEKQRLLDDNGRTLARALGDRWREMNIPVSRVISGELCRVKETAELLGIKAVETVAELNDFNTWKAQGRDVNELPAAYRKMLTTIPDSGTNVILVSHVQRGRFAAHPGLDLIEMGGAAIFRTSATGFELLAILHHSDWARLGKADAPFPR